MEFTADAMRELSRKSRRALPVSVVQERIRKRARTNGTFESFWREELSEGVKAGLRIAGFTVTDFAITTKVEWDFPITARAEW